MKVAELLHTFNTRSKRGDTGGAKVLRGLDVRDIHEQNPPEIQI